MSKISITDMNKIRATEYSKEKEERIEARKKELYEKMDSLLLKYFDESNDYSVNNSLKRAFAKSDIESKEIVFYMNFDRQDFLGWSRFVPYKADPDNGHNINGRATECCNRFLKYSQEKEFLPRNVDFDVWKNKKFTVKFTIKNLDQ